MKEIWYVNGADPEFKEPVYFENKISAETYARFKFPEEPINVRYARVHSKGLYNLEVVCEDGER